MEGLILRLRVRRLGLMVGLGGFGSGVGRALGYGSGLGQSAVVPRPFICIWWEGGMAGGDGLTWLWVVAHCLIDCVWSSGWDASCHLG